VPRPRSDGKTPQPGPALRSGRRQRSPCVCQAVRFVRRRSGASVVVDRPAHHAGRAGAPAAERGTGHRRRRDGRARHQL
nr:hypothetical protein [Tanacetum cinerariifolium]